jgi:hypothetical protein
MSDEILFGTGALPDPIDENDLLLKMASRLGAIEVDWDTPFQLPMPPHVNQGSADCCVACAWSYFHWQVTGKTFSVRDLFCRIFLDYGAYIRDGGLELVNRGQAETNEVKDPSPMSASNMRSTNGTKDEYRIDGKVYKAFSLPQQDMNGYAWAIDNYKGVVFGVYGTNPGWKDKENPRPPSIGEAVWGHALYGLGHHMHNGRKCILAMPSWIVGGTKLHHIKEDYFYAMQGTFSAWVLIPKDQIITKPMYKKAVHADGKTFAVLIITPNGSTTIDATSEEVWRSFSKADSYQLNTINSDGKTNFDKSDCVQLPW